MISFTFNMQMQCGFLVQEKVPGTSLHQILLHSPPLWHDNIWDDLAGQLKAIINDLSQLDDPCAFG
jgi:hypothetical protein